MSEQDPGPIRYEGQHRVRWFDAQNRYRCVQCGMSSITRYDFPGTGCDGGGR